MSASPVTSFGIDFGTSNTVVAKATAGGDGAVEILRLGTPPGGRGVHPSVLAFEEAEERGRPVLAAETGERAIDLASRHPEDFRYVQSFKSYVASHAFDGTNILGRRFEFPDLLSAFLTRAGIARLIRETPGPKRVVVGRPVTFHGDAPDDDLAVSRYRAAFAAAGVADFDLALEPVGGAFSFFRRLRSSVRVLIADLGGGTSDFAVARFSLGEDGVRSALLSHAGVGIAGDRFDFRIVQNALLKHFGAGTGYRNAGKLLPVPKTYYTALSQWHRLTRLRAPRYLDALKDIRRTAEAPAAIDTLIHAIEHNAGLAIARTVSRAKARLSEAETAELAIDLGAARLRETVARADFEAWIAEDLALISSVMTRAIEEAGLCEAEIDHVFLTGGTSLVPAVHGLFVERFGTGKIHAGERFSAVAEGLALIGRAPDSDLWLSK